MVKVNERLLHLMELYIKRDYSISSDEEKANQFGKFIRRLF